MLRDSLTQNIEERRVDKVVKALNIDTELLDKAIDKSGLKSSFIAEKLGISRQAFNKKRLGKTAFRQSEVFVMCTLLKLSDAECMQIFFPEMLG